MAEPLDGAIRGVTEHTNRSRIYEHTNRYTDLEV
jgi:hypothetical protein